jgi:8-oxo-dGTP diphosphatase
VSQGARIWPALHSVPALWLNATHVGSLLDFSIRSAYKVAHRMLRAYWFVRRPSTHGSLVALWHDGEILLVKNSYRRQYTLPGGYIHRGESAVEAAARELREEVGIDVPPSAVRQAFTGVHEFEFREDKVTISELEVHERPAVDIDNREVVWAGFMAPAAVLELDVVPHIRDYLRGRG